MRCVRRIAVLGLALLSAAALPPQGKRAAAKAVLAPFNGSYEDAQQRAFERNVPLIAIAIVESDSGALDEDIAKFRRELTTQPDFAAASQYAVVVLAANKLHENVKVELEEHGAKTVKTLCSVYRTEGCVVHQKQFDTVYREHNVEGELRSPSVFVVQPDRKPAQSWQTGSAPAWADVVGALAAVRAKAGEGLTEAQFAEVRALLLRGDKEMQDAQWGAAHSTWRRVLEITQTTRQAEHAREQLAQALAGLTALREEARAWIAEGRVVDGYRRLLEIQPHAAGTPLEKDLLREILALENGKDTKDAIAAYKREQEAEKLWREALELEGKAAETKLRLLLRKFGDTAAGQRARERYPALAADEDARRKAGGGD